MCCGKPADALASVDAGASSISCPREANPWVIASIVSALLSGPSDNRLAKREMTAESGVPSKRVSLPPSRSVACCRPAPTTMIGQPWRPSCKHAPFFASDVLYLVHREDQRFGIPQAVLLGQHQHALKRLSLAHGPFDADSRPRHRCASRSVSQGCYPLRCVFAMAQRRDDAREQRELIAYAGRGKAKPRHRSRGVAVATALLVNSSSSCVLPTPCTPSARIIAPETSPVPRMYWRCLVIAPSSSPRPAKC